MMRLFKQGLLLLAMSIISCNNSQENENETSMKKQDPHSYAVPAEAKVKHLSWRARINFESMTIEGTASWEIEHNKSDSIRLDTKDLNIKTIKLDDNRATTFRMGPKDPILGQALVISIKPDTKLIHIDYQTSPKAEALQWLSPQQTAGKNFPFLFTQSQAILARSW